MDLVVDNIINTINDHPEWDKLLKMRYAFLELGKNVHKDARFFYSLYNVLGEKNYTREEIEEIAETDELLDQVTCHNSAKALKQIFDAVGIECRIVDLFLNENDIFELADGTKIGIKHCFVAAKDDLGRDIIITLNHDLANIQVGRKTANFGKHITYINPSNGKQIYEGEEIDPYVVSNEELYAMDLKLGYLMQVQQSDCSIKYDYSDWVFDAIKAKFSVSKENIELLTRVDNNKLYKLLIETLNKASGSTETECFNVELSKIQFDTWEDIKELVCVYAIERARILYGFSNTSDEVKELNVLIEKKNYREAIKLLKHYIDAYGINKKMEDIFSPNAFAGQISSFFRTIDEIEQVDDFSSPKGISCKNKLNNGITSICKFFINPDLIFPNNYDYSNDYIINKLKVACPMLFDLGMHTNFCEMGIAEQMSILDQLLSCILPELKNNTKTIDQIIVDGEDVSETRMNSTLKRGIASRIKTAALYSRDSNVVNYLIYIYSNDKDSDKVLMYDFNTNTIQGFDEDISLFDLAQNYIISSNKLTIAAEEQEDIKVL